MKNKRKQNNLFKKYLIINSCDVQSIAQERVNELNSKFDKI